MKKLDTTWEIHQCKNITRLQFTSNYRSIFHVYRVQILTMPLFVEQYCEMHTWESHYVSLWCIIILSKHMWNTCVLMHMHTCTCMSIHDTAHIGHIRSCITPSKHHTVHAPHNPCTTSFIHHTVHTPHNQYTTQSMHHTTHIPHCPYTTQPIFHTVHTPHNPYSTLSIHHTTHIPHCPYTTQPIYHTVHTPHSPYFTLVMHNTDHTPHSPGQQFPFEWKGSHSNVNISFKMKNFVFKWIHLHSNIMLLQWRHTIKLKAVHSNGRFINMWKRGIDTNWLTAKLAILSCLKMSIKSNIDISYGYVTYHKVILYKEWLVSL